MSFKAFLIVFIAFFLSLTKVNAQTNTFQLWLDYDHQNKLNTNWKMFTDYGFRVQFDKWVRFHARTAAIYKPSTLLDYRAGLGLFYLNYRVSENVMEVRPWQGLKVAWPNWNRFRFTQYARLEERMVFDLESPENDFKLKFRYKLAINFPINNNTISVGTFYIPASAEVFVDLFFQDSEFNNDRLRFELGLGYRWKKDNYVKVLYTLQELYFDEESSFNLGEGFHQIDHVVRITVSQKFGFDK